jgi:hypothetical protein
VSEHETPNWQPLSFLPDLAAMVDGMLEGAEEVCQSLRQAQDRPHVLDDYTVGRVREVRTTQRNDLWLYEEQLSRWQDAAPTSEQSTEITRVQQQLDRLKSVLTSSLALVDELAEGTIEKVLGKSDIELAMDVLSGKRKLQVDLHRGIWITGKESVPTMVRRGCGPAHFRRPCHRPGRT